MSQNLQSKSRKTLERIRLADSIAKFGFNVMPCSFFPRLSRESDRLEQAEEEAEEKLLKAQQEVNEAIARLSRIRRQKRILRERGIQSIVDGMNSSAGDLIAQEEDAAVLDVQSFGGTDVIDWNMVFGSLTSDVVGESSSGVVGH
ncbi:hypothetical protein FBEOM_6259 [Fusarium beomiforme]|uniref:Uncharacterized protein n=1 Tax=Fusarium beomiforme TaxID=44412 RepID=A0A9P5DY75_9HYPO|nr:hypothetical protein FBEOM_6259 [Fusarium beomiforme]